MQLVDYMPEEFAQKIDPKELTDKPVGIISITDPDRRAQLHQGWADMLRLQFDDVDPEYLEQLSPEERERKVLFNEDHANQVVRWLRKNEGRLHVLLVHCWAGISRSGAVAKFVADKHGLPFPEQRAEFINEYVYDLLQKADAGQRVDKAPERINVNGHLYLRVPETSD